MEKQLIKNILELWDLEEEWNQIYEPEMTIFGNMEFNYINGELLERSVAISRKQKEVKKKIRNTLGIIRYIMFLIRPISFFRNIKV